LASVFALDPHTKKVLCWEFGEAENSDNRKAFFAA
jgi:hypothetical protein